MRKRQTPIRIILRGLALAVLFVAVELALRIVMQGGGSVTITLGETVMFGLIVSLIYAVDELEAGR